MDAAGQSGFAGISPFEPQEDPGAITSLPDEARRMVDYTVKLDSDARKRLARHVCEEITRYYEATQGRRDNLQQWRSDWAQRPVPTSRHAGASELCSPFTRIYSNNHVTRLNSQIIQPDPPVSAVARKADAIDAAPGIEEAMAASLDEAQWPLRAQDAHQECVIAGNVFLRLTYDEVYRRRPTIQTEWNEELFAALVSGGANPLQAFEAAVERDARGNPKVELVWNEELRSAGARYKVIPWEDGVILPVSIRDPEDARGIGERLVIRGSDLMKGAKSGKYFPDAVAEVLKHPSDPTPDDRAEALDDQGTDPNVETEPVDGDPAFRDYLCHELCYQFDGNDDGEAEWCVLTIHTNSQTLLRAQYLSYEHGEAYYGLLRYMRRTDELWAMGVPEVLAGIQDCHTALLNQIVDSGDSALNFRGNFFYDSNSGFKPDKFVFEFGKPIPVDSVDGIKPIPINPLSPEHYALHQTLKDLADLLTSTSNPGLGRETDADKTLGEVQLVVAAADLIFEEISKGVALQWCPFFDQHRWLLAQFGESGVVKYRKSAEPGAYILGTDGQQTPAARMGGQLTPAPGGIAFGQISAEVLLADVDLVPTGLSQMGDAQARLNQAALVQQTVLTHPLAVTCQEAQLIALDVFLQATRYPQRDKVLDAIKRQLMAIAMAEQAMAAAATEAATAEGEIAGQEGARTANAAEAQLAAETAAAVDAPFVAAP